MCACTERERVKNVGITMLLASVLNNTNNDTKNNLFTLSWK
jgi:hypothetical protein